MADVDVPHQDILPMPDVLKGDWIEIVESRLIGVAEEQHRQHAFGLFLEYLHSLVKVIAQMFSRCDFPNLQTNLEDDAYTFHEMRMSVKERKKQREEDVTSVPRDHHNAASLSLQISSLIRLLTWLISSFWSDSFNSNDDLRDDSLKKQQVTCAPKQWVQLLQNLVSLTDDIMAVLKENSEFTGSGELRDSVRLVTEVVGSMLAGSVESGIKEMAKELEPKESKSLEKGRTTEELMEMVDERLEGYEDHFQDILTNPQLHQDQLWIKFLETNADLLLDKRNMSSLLEVAIQYQHQPEEAFIVSGLCKLSLHCLGQLPLPVFMNIHEWLWDSPERSQLFMSRSCDDFDLHLNQTFNKLTSTDTSKLAIQVGCLLLQRPEATLQRLLQHVMQNQEAVNVLMKVLQSLPPVREFVLPGMENSILFHTLSTVLPSEKLSKPGETNLLSFTLNVAQPTVSACDPQYPAKQPPLLSCHDLMMQLLLPSISVEQKPDCDPPVPVEGSRQKTIIPLKRSLKLLRGLLGLNLVPVDLLCPSILCLCELLDSSDIGSVEFRRSTRELVLQNLQLACEEIPSSPDNTNCDLLWESLSGFHWSTKLKVAFNLQTSSPDLKGYCQESLDAILLALESYCNVDNASTKEEELATWGTILQVSSVSKELAKKCCKIISTTVLSRSGGYSLNHQSLMVALVFHLGRCTVTEWENDMTLLRGLLGTVFTIPYDSQFTCYVPFSLKDISMELTLSQMLLAVLEMSALLTTHSWQHIIKCYMLAMQDMLQTNRENCSNKPLRCFLAGQIFCHSCLAMKFIPIECRETLLVLKYEVLSHLEEEEPRSEVKEWHHIQGDMLEAAHTGLDDTEAIRRKLKDLT